MNTPDCPHCGLPMEYGGIDDGGGDYGASICDTWYCDACQYGTEMDCVEFDDDDEIIEAMPPDDDQQYSPPARDMDDIPF